MYVNGSIIISLINHQNFANTPYMPFLFRSCLLRFPLSILDDAHDRCVSRGGWNQQSSSNMAMNESITTVVVSILDVFFMQRIVLRLSSVLAVKMQWYIHQTCVFVPENVITTQFQGIVITFKH